MGVKYCGNSRYSAMFEPAGISDSSGDGGGKCLSNVDIPKDNSVSL